MSRLPMRSPPLVVYSHAEKLISEARESSELDANVRKDRHGLLAAVLGEIESKDTFVVSGTLKHLSVA